MKKLILLALFLCPLTLFAQLDNTSRGGMMRYWGNAAEFCVEDDHPVWCGDGLKVEILHVRGHDWRDTETAPGVYDFSKYEAAARWAHEWDIPLSVRLYPHIGKKNRTIPSWIPTRGCGEGVADFTDTSVMASFDRLQLALKARISPLHDFIRWEVPYIGWAGEPRTGSISGNDPGDCFTRSQALAIHEWSEARTLAIHSPAHVISNMDRGTIVCQMFELGVIASRQDGYVTGSKFSNYTNIKNACPALFETGIIIFEMWGGDFGYFYHDPEVLGPPSEIIFEATDLWSVVYFGAMGWRVTICSTNTGNTFRWPCVPAESKAMVEEMVEQINTYAPARIAAWRGFQGPPGPEPPTPVDSSRVTAIGGLIVRAIQTPSNTYDGPPVASKAFENPPWRVHIEAGQGIDCSIFEIEPATAQMDISRPSPCLVNFRSTEPGILVRFGPKPESPPEFEQRVTDLEEAVEEINRKLRAAGEIFIEGL